MVTEAEQPVTVPTHHGEAWHELSDCPCAAHHGNVGCNLIDKALVTVGSMGPEHQSKLLERAKEVAQTACATCIWRTWSELPTNINEE